MACPRKRHYEEQLSSDLLYLFLLFFFFLFQAEGRRGGPERPANLVQHLDPAPTHLCLLKHTLLLPLFRQLLCLLLRRLLLLSLALQESLRRQVELHSHGVHGVATTHDRLCEERHRGSHATDCGCTHLRLRVQQDSWPLPQGWRLLSPWYAAARSGGGPAPAQEGTQLALPAPSRGATRHRHGKPLAHAKAHHTRASVTTAVCPFDPHALVLVVVVVVVVVVVCLSGVASCCQTMSVRYCVDTEVSVRDCCGNRRSLARQASV